MTWNELIARLNEIPEERREDRAIFSDLEGTDWEIDDKDKVRSSELVTDPTPQEETPKECYILTP